MMRLELSFPPSVDVPYANEGYKRGRHKTVLTKYGLQRQPAELKNMSDEQVNSDVVMQQPDSPQQEVSASLYDNTESQEVQQAQSDQDQSEPQQKEDVQTEKESNSQENDQDKNSFEILGAPENYSFKEFEGADFDPVIQDGLKEAARELDLSRAAMDKFMDKMAPLAVQRQQERMAELSQGFITASTNDKEFGGERLQENLGLAQKAMGQFGSPELKEFLNQSGLGNHPELIRTFYRVGKNMSEDGYVGSSQGAMTRGETPKDFNGMARAFYEN
ncbi:hypothetical protein BAnh1_09910 [Bartonella australis AUST/NH1]|uniref:Phage protein n=2 Tax=Bartonella australis TaxID=388640 RepID=M1PE24_BARAA|nr:hypothetical protein BAnh1_09910 [Bartonella australis AUST/NH1]